MAASLAACLACTGQLIPGRATDGDGGPELDTGGGDIDGDISDPQPDRCERDIAPVPGLGDVAEVTFATPRGFYQQPFELVIATATAGATIYYTTDGSRPSPSNGSPQLSPLTLPVSTTTVVRAMAEADGLDATRVYTNSYIFLDDVLRQPAAREGYPQPRLGSGSSTSVTLDYEMDSEVVDDPAYAGEMVDAMVAIPSLSIVMDRDDMFGDDGVYRNGGGSGGLNADYERPASIELIYADSLERGFQIDASVRPHSWSPLADAQFEALP